MKLQSSYSVLLSMIAGIALTVSGCTPNVQRTPAAQADAKTVPAAAAPQARPKPFLGGVIEGYYGKPWSVADTVQMIRFIGEHHMNAYVYAPKDDPYQRSKWNVLYPNSGLTNLKTLIHAAEQNHVQFVYSVSPGLNITYSSNKDRAALLAKIDQLRKLGVHDFMLSLDDIYHGLNKVDQQRYGNDMAYAQSDVANLILQQETKRDASFRLIMTPTQYYGTDDKPYWASLKKYLYKDVDVVWTGPWVLSEMITVPDIQTVSNFIGHKLVIWDNYPVNDYTYTIDKRPQLFMGPVVGRTAGVPAAVAGYLFNPMVQARASELALWTGGEFLYDPKHYNPKTAWDQAIRGLGGPAAATFRLFAEDSSSYYRDHKLPVQLNTDITLFWSLPHGSNLKTSALARDFQQMSEVDPDLANSLPDHKLYAEIEPWTKLLSEEGQAGALAIDVLDAHNRGNATDSEIAKLTAIYKDISSNTNTVAGDLVPAFVQRVLGQVT